MSRVRTEWFTIGGFSRFASRRDLEICLGAVKPLKIDPILDSSCYATGKWAVLIPNMNNIQLRNTMAIKNNKVTCAVLGKDEFNLLKLASKNGITDCTVRFKNVQCDVDVDELRYFLQDFELDSGSDAVTPFLFDKKVSTNQYLVNFASPEEAERAVLEKCFTAMDGIPIQMHWYNC
jgi:hypothetical protein